MININLYSVEIVPIYKGFILTFEDAIKVYAKYFLRVPPGASQIKIGNYYVPYFNNDFTFYDK
jgi:hypothetical protein